MGKISDNLNPKLILVEGTTPATPSAGSQKVFIDSADHKLKRVNSSGTVTTIEGGGGGAAGRVLLKQTTLAADAASIGFTNTDIPTSGYAHLRVILVGRTNEATTGSSVLVALNGDTAIANYTSQRLYGAQNAAGANLFNNTVANARRIGGIDAANNPAGSAGVVDMVFYDYLGSWYKMAKAESSKIADPTVEVNALRWANAAAITSLTLTPGAGNFLAGTKAFLYGEV